MKLHLKQNWVAEAHSHNALYKQYKQPYRQATSDEMLSPLLQAELEDVQSKLHALKPLVELKDSPVHQQVK